MCILNFKTSSLSTSIANNKSNVEDHNLNFLYLYKRKHDGMMLVMSDCALGIFPIEI